MLSTWHIRCEKDGPLGHIFTSTCLTMISHFDAASKEHILFVSGLIAKRALPVVICTQKYQNWFSIKLSSQSCDLSRVGAVLSRTAKDG